MTLTTKQLTQALKDAAVAHHAFETALGHPDADWQAWYAEWIALKFPDPKPVASCLNCSQPIAIAWKPLPSELPLDAPFEYLNDDGATVYSYHAKAHNAYSANDNGVSL